MSPERHLSHRGSTLTRRLSLNASVRKAALEEDHAIALEDFKERIAQAGLKLPVTLLVSGDLDSTLIRFLRARKYHVDHAMAMLEKSLQWRAKVGADSVLERDHDARLKDLVRQCRPSSYIGFDSQHHPIFLERLGKLDGRRIEKEGLTDEDILNYHLCEMEFMAQVVFTEASAAAGHTVDRVVSIMDAAGLTLTALTGFAQRLFRLITAMDSDNYPETCHAIYIVNGGATFSAIWRVVSPFVDKGTRDKVHVLGGGKHMQQVLFGEFGADKVPTFLGGSLDYDAVRQSWCNKMDAAMEDLKQHPHSQQPPVILQPSSTMNGHHHHHQEHQHPHHQQHDHVQHQQHQHQQQHGSFSGLLPRLAHLASGSGRLDRHSSETDGWGTPLSGASKFSCTSGVSVYFDALESADSITAKPAAAAATGPSPPGSTAATADHRSTAGSSTAAAATAATAADHRGGSITPIGASGTPRAAAAGGNATPPAAASPGGSLSVGPHSCTRSQLSGFTVGPSGAVVVSGAGGASSVQEVGDHPGLEGLELQHKEQQQPHCGCKCVIC